MGEKKYRKYNLNPDAASRIKMIIIFTVNALHAFSHFALVVAVFHLI